MRITHLSGAAISSFLHLIEGNDWTLPQPSLGKAFWPAMARYTRGQPWRGAIRQVNSSSFLVDQMYFLWGRLLCPLMSKV